MQLGIGGLTREDGAATRQPSEKPVAEQGGSVAIEHPNWREAN